jgi:hypothetical protein
LNLKIAPIGADTPRTTSKSELLHRRFVAEIETITIFHNSSPIWYGYEVMLVLLNLCISITYEIYSSVLKPAVCGLRGNLVPRAFPFLSLGSREKALAPGGHMTFNTQI